MGVVYLADGRSDMSTCQLIRRVEFVVTCLAEVGSIGLTEHRRHIDFAIVAPGFVARAAFFIRVILELKNVLRQDLCARLDKVLVRVEVGVRRVNQVEGVVPLWYAFLGCGRLVLGCQRSSDRHFAEQDAA